jgi:hypothetical protein
VDWIGLAKDRNRWRAVVNAVMNLGKFSSAPVLLFCLQTSIAEHQQAYSPDKTNDLIDAFLHEMETEKGVETSSFTGSHTRRYHNISHLIISHPQLHTLHINCVYGNAMFWHITPCSPLKVNRRFGVTCRLHAATAASEQVQTKCAASWAQSMGRYVPQETGYRHYTLGDAA